MIRYALKCVGEHKFEAWFSNSEAFDVQKRKGLIECPRCGSTKIEKQIMAPAVRSSRKAATAKGNAEAEFAQLAGKVRQHIEDTHEFVGDKFADEARAIHAGEADDRPLWGEASLETAKQLAEEGVPALPLPEPFAPEKPKSKKQLN